MTKYQRYVLIATLAATAIAALFPPFQFVTSGTAFNLGYGFLFVPPTWVVQPGSVNVPMLFAEFLGIGIVGCAAYALFRKD